MVHPLVIYDKIYPMFKRITAIAVALASLSVAAQVASALPSDRLALAKQLANRGLYAEALKEFEAIHNNPAVPRDEVCYRLAETYRNLKRHQDALRIYDELLKNHPQSRYVDFARMNRALLLTGNERIRELAALNHKGASEQIRVTALYWLGMAAEEAKDPRSALVWYDKSASISPTNDVARLSRLRSAAILAASEDSADHRKAQSIYLDMAAGADTALAKEALYLVGMLSYREGRHKEAAEMFNRLTTRFPDSDRSRECALYASWANYLSGRYTETLKLAAPLRSAGNEDAYYLVAASLRYLERRADAVDAYDAALKAFPNGRHADSEWFERLGVLATSGDHQAVLAALETRPHPPKKTADRAWSYGCESAIAVTNFPRAIEYARLIVQHPGTKMAPNAVLRLAWLYEKTEDWARSALAYRTLADKWPEAPIAAQALYQSGVTEAKAGNPAQARADWTKLLTLHPESTYAGEALAARAMEELRAKEFRAAERSIAELSHRFPDRVKGAEILYWWGVAASGIDDGPEAEKHFRAALAAHPTAEFEREIKLELASILQKRGEKQEAAQLFASLLETKAVDRLPPQTLSWVSESMLAVTNFNAALTAAKVIEARKLDADWKQIGATLVGQAYEGLGERDAASAAYARALATGAQTMRGAQSALALGRIESANGLFDQAKAHLSDAVQRAAPQSLLGLRLQAYVALAANEEERGDSAAALGYHMLVGTLFDDAEHVPHAIARAAAILRQQGRVDEAAKLDAERKKRYPNAPTEK